MFRRGLIDILKAHPVSRHALAMLLDERPRDLFRSLRNDPMRPAILSASCRKCGSGFDEDKLHKPGKSPRRKGIWISEPLISLEETR